MRKLNTRGMTLVEVVVAVALFAIAAALILTSVGAAYALVRRGADSENAGSLAFKVIENDSGTPTPGSVSFSVNGKSYTVDGSYYTAAEQEGAGPAIEFHAFVPDAAGGVGSE
ncbi:MAG: prepilin-type N-terminal cleavage/methylation domain-containing protein [Clostridiaceae bacterium]|nr:prepilin-type N-terminal cleavage/methylation domain-containing protein [Clostridiaceae bacterium]